MTSRFLPLMSICSACCVLQTALVAPAPAQEVEWRYDYPRARQEALEKSRPLVIDVGTVDCYWCKQLDVRTFRDPAIVSILNDRCIPLKIDAQQHPRLVEALKVQNYPTMVFASAEGRILDYQVGFIESAALQERLARIVGPATPPSEPNNRDLVEARRAVGTGDYARAILLLKSVLDENKDKAIQAQAKQMLQDLEQQAAGRCAEAKQLVENGKVSQAMETATQLVQTYPGTKAATEGGQLLVTLASRAAPAEQSRSRLARELLNQAKEDQRQQHFLSCLDRCETLIAQYADLPEGSEATKLTAEIKANPEWTKQACDQLGDRLSLLYLSLADTLLKKGQPQQAVFYLERVIQTFPNSPSAGAAQVRLIQIQGQPAGHPLPEIKK
jgi:tetratricopeptide (TPR) repeat protein